MLEHQPAAQRKLEEVKGEITEMLRNREASALALKDGSAKLEQLRKGDQGKMNDLMKDAMRQLKSPSDGALSDMNKALSKGDYKKASEELAKAMNKASTGEMTEQERKALAEQMKKLSEQLQKLAEQQKAALEKALEEAGLKSELEQLGFGVVAFACTTCNGSVDA